MEKTRLLETALAQCESERKELEARVIQLESEKEELLQSRPIIHVSDQHGDHKLVMETMHLRIEQLLDEISGLKESQSTLRLIKQNESDKLFEANTLLATKDQQLIQTKRQLAQVQFELDELKLKWSQMDPFVEVSQGAVTYKNDIPSKQAVSLMNDDIPSKEAVTYKNDDIPSKEAVSYKNDIPSKQAVSYKNDIPCSQEAVSLMNDIPFKEVMPFKDRDCQGDFRLFKDKDNDSKFFINNPSKVYPRDIEKEVKDYSSSQGEEGLTNEQTTIEALEVTSFLSDTPNRQGLLSAASPSIDRFFEDVKPSPKMHSSSSIDTLVTVDHATLFQDTPTIKPKKVVVDRNKPQECKQQ